jgi:PKD repeat protein
MKRVMTIITGIIIVTVTLNAAYAANTSYPSTYTFTNLGDNYIPEGINNAGTIVGFYENGSNNRGFILSGGNYTLFDYPGGNSTNAIRINDDGTIVGIYKDSQGNEHGFTLSNGTPASVDYPGAKNTYASGINNDGTIVGYYSYDDNVAHGFILKNGTYTSFDYPGASNTYVSGINYLDNIIGWETGADGRQHGFTLIDGTYTSFDYPGANNTYAADINIGGTIVGWWTYPNGDTSSFTMLNGVFAPIDIADIRITDAAGINDADTIVGSWSFVNGVLITGYTAQNISVGNIDNISDTFTVWMDLKQNKDGNPAPNQCGNVLKAVDSAGRTALQQSCVFLDQGTGRHTITLKITDDGTQLNKRARYIEKAAFYLCSNMGSGAGDLSSCSLIGGIPEDFSVYGTTFDIGKHAWQFSNGAQDNSPGQLGTVQWWATHNSIYYAADVITSYLKDSDKFTFWGSVGYASYGAAYTFSLPFMYVHKSDGFCYGLANSAIANYTHQDDTEAWGIETFTKDSWNTDIINRWADPYKATSPFGALAPDANIFTAPSLNSPSTVWSIDSAKKIMYYFVAQQQPFQGGQNWVGKDLNNTLITSETDNSVISILKNGSPVAVGFDIEQSVSGHAVVVPQMIIQNGQTQLTIWDNNWPLGSMDAASGPYAVIQNAGGPYLKIDKSSGSFKSLLNWDVSMLTFVPLLCGDSQNIYNQWSAPCATSQSAISQAAATDIVDYQYPDHVQVLVIGAQVNSVYDQTANSSVTLIPNGDIIAGQAVQTVSGNGLFTSLYLPVADTYQIQATKYAGFAGLEVFVIIPNADGTVQQLNYENLATAVADATQIAFTVGSGNTNTGISRTIANDIYNPDYNANVATILNPPTNLNAIVNNSGTGVALSWTNTSNPLFASVLVIRKAGSAPSASTDGVTVYSGPGQSVADTVSANTVYYYAVYSMDGLGNLSTSAVIKVNTGLESVYGTILTSVGGLSNASVQLLDSHNNVIGVATSAPDGTYAISNITNGSYTLTASHPTAVINPTSVVVTLNGNSQEEDFSATNQETLFLLFNASSVTVGNTVSIQWTYRNIGNNETVNISLLRNSVWETIASGVPILNGMVSWTVTAPDVSSAMLQISLADNPTINAQYYLTLVPSYDFLGTPTTGPAPLAVMFVDKSSSSTAWLWDFGDNTTSTEQNPLHMYTNPGTYTVSLTITGSGGQVITTKSNYITVSGTCTELPVTFADTNAYYPSIGSALSVVGAGQTLLIQDTSLSESLSTSQDVLFTLSGGYSCDYSMNPGFTTVHGTLTISHGTVIIENLIIQ